MELGLAGRHPAEALRITVVIEGDALLQTDEEPHVPSEQKSYSTLNVSFSDPGLSRTLPAGLTIFGRDEVTHSLTPAMRDNPRTRPGCGPLSNCGPKRTPSLTLRLANKRRGDMTFWWGRSHCDGCLRSRRTTSSSPGSSPRITGGTATRPRLREPSLAGRWRNQQTSCSP